MSFFGSTQYHSNIPIANRKGTIMGVAIAFQILSTIAVVLRFYVRGIVYRKLGWDDTTAFSAWAALVVGSAFVCLSVNAGLGQHFDTLTFTEIKRFYVTYVAYSVSATLVKLSLLLQYMRFLRDSRLRYACIMLMVISGMWGFAYSFMALFPCFPVKAYWDWSVEGAVCYGYGVKKEHPFVEVFVTHAAINVLLDLCILVVPAPILFKKVLTKREKWSVGGLAAMGIVVIWLCTWRMVTIVIHRAGWAPTRDFTWWAPISIILGCLEAQIAVIATSIPIFWTVVENRILRIFVRNEIEIVEISHPLELDDRSVKSYTGSEDGLTKMKRWSPPKAGGKHESFYKEVIERVSPSLSRMESRLEAQQGYEESMTRILSR